MERAKNWTNLISLLCVLLLFYSLFYFIFFFVLGNNSVEFVIAFSFIFLVYLSYKKVSTYVYFYLWNLSKDIWLHYASLLFILKATREMILSLNKSYLNFLQNKLVLLNNVSYSLDDIWGNLNITLLKKYFVNNVLKQLLYKYSLIYANTNKINKFILLDMNLYYKVKILSIYNLIVFFKQYNNK
jgi:hypothetical protein